MKGVASFVKLLAVGEPSMKRVIFTENDDLSSHLICHECCFGNKNHIKPLVSSVFLGAQNGLLAAKLMKHFTLIYFISFPVWIFFSVVS